MCMSSVCGYAPWLPQHFQSEIKLLFLLFIVYFNKSEYQSNAHLCESVAAL